MSRRFAGANRLLIFSYNPMSHGYKIENTKLDQPSPRYSIYMVRIKWVKWNLEDRGEKKNRKGTEKKYREKKTNTWNTLNRSEWGRNREKKEESEWSIRICCVYEWKSKRNLHSFWQCHLCIQTTNDRSRRRYILYI